MFPFQVSGKPSAAVALLVAALAPLALASETRHYAPDTAVLGGVAGLHGAGVAAGVGHGLSAGLGHGLGAGLGLGHGVAAGFGHCKNWCKAPSGRYECCDDLKPGQCPPVRPTCPSVRSDLPPTPCTNDAYCPGTDKCCYDVCLEHRTCKPVSAFY